MPMYHALGEFPRKRHTQFRAPDGKLYVEEVFGLEGFDALGRPRTAEDGRTIDDRGLVTEADVTGPFRGPAELAALVARSADARNCFVAQMTRFAEGSPADLCQSGPLSDAFVRSGGRLTEVLLAYVERREFYVRRVTP